MNKERYREMARDAAVGAVAGALVGLLALGMSEARVGNPQPHTPVFTYPDWEQRLNEKIAENPFPTIVFPAAVGAAIGLAASRRR